MILVLDGAHVWMRVLLVLRNFADLVCILGCTTLAQVHVRESAVTVAPWITGCSGVHVELDVAELIDPTHEVAICIGIAAALAATHGDTHHIALLDFLDSCQGRDLS